MRLALVRPPRPVKRYFLASMLPLNLAGLASFIRLHGFDVQLWDYEHEGYREEDFLKRLADYQPDIVGFSCFSSNIKNGAELSTVVKKYNPHCLNIVGGPHCSAIPEDTLREFSAFDIAVIGEGEIALLDICRSISGTKSVEGIKGIAVRKKNGEIVINKENHIIEDLDTLPMPALDLLNLNLYHTSMRGFSSEFLMVAEIQTSRGCPFQCSFCASFLSSRRKVRYKSVSRVAEEIKFYQQHFGANHINIIDDTFILDKNRVRAIADILYDLNLTWNCWAHVGVYMDESFLKYIKDKGCEGLLIGVESGSERILKLLKKGLTVEKIKRAFSVINRIGFKNVEANFIVGSHPSETIEDIKLTRMLIKEIKPTILAVSIIVPFPGTETYNIMKKEGLINSFDWNHYVTYGAEPKWRTHNFSEKDLVKLQQNLMFSFYFSPRSIQRRMFLIKSFSEFLYYLKGGISFLKDILYTRLRYLLNIYQKDNYRY